MVQFSSALIVEVLGIKREGCSIDAVDDSACFLGGSISLEPSRQYSILIKGIKHLY